MHSDAITLPGAAALSAAPRGPWKRLLGEVLQLAGPEAEFVQHTERPWSSAMFTGSRHTVTLVFNGTGSVQQGELYLSALPDHEFAIPGQLVADAAIAAVTRETVPVPRLIVETELLLLDDA